MNNTMKKLATALATVLISATAASAQITTITEWNFQIVSEGVTNGTSTPSIGTGTVTTIGGVSNPGFNSGSGSTDPLQPGFGYQTDSYPAQGAGGGTAGVRFDLSTAGFTTDDYDGVRITFDLRLSNTSSRWFRLDYTVDGGSSWVLGTATRLGASANAGDTWFNDNQVIIGDLTALDNADFGFRVVSVFSPVDFTQVSGGINYDADTAYEVARNNGSSVYAGGTWRFDMVTVEAIPEPSTYALLAISAAGLAAWRLHGRGRRESNRLKR